MILESGIFAKVILLILFFFSIISWGIIINKLRLFRKVETETKRFISIFRKSKTISEAYLACATLRRTPLSMMLESGFKETEMFSKKDSLDNPREKVWLTPEKKSEVVRMTLDRVGAEEINKLERNVVFLATTGNISPFLGLLGTVWGIMDSFASIGIRGSASLAVVAPGIAEALIATIFGLAVAIPGVIGYNYFNNRLKFVTSDIENFSLEFLSSAKKEGIL
ncbi:MAG: MotA/TolQ/ExbB proton channel family protein [candidate division Zixibacteria bacterium]|nr:MotA/TolQ/ExbB proton channel family protein [candidate division Zixibacteria bacterium]